jgi:aspartate-semialdehyde dehydrogenase
MKVFAIVHPASLVAKELREQLERRPDLWREIRLLTTTEEEVGMLTDVGGAAAVVHRVSAETLEGVDLMFLCGTAAQAREAVAAASPGARTISLAFDASAADGPPLVAGINLGETTDATAASSPHPGAILVAHLLRPLTALGLQRAEATLLQPVSVFDGPALDQLYEQAKGLLTFQSVPDADRWRGQLAFNVMPVDGAPADLGRLVETVLGGDSVRTQVSVQVLQAGIFHGFSGSVHLMFEPDPGVEAVRAALTDQPWLRLADEDRLGPTDAAAADDVLLGHVRAEPNRPGSYWVWGVMDNLTRGGASNAVAIAEAMSGR